MNSAASAAPSYPAYRSPVILFLWSVWSRDPKYVKTRGRDPKYIKTRGRDPKYIKTLLRYGNGGALVQDL